MRRECIRLANFEDILSLLSLPSIPYYLQYGSARSSFPPPTYSPSSVTVIIFLQSLSLTLSCSPLIPSPFVVVSTLQHDITTTKRELWRATWSIPLAVQHRNHDPLSRKLLRHVRKHRVSTGRRKTTDSCPWNSLSSNCNRRGKSIYWGV